MGSLEESFSVQAPFKVVLDARMVKGKMHGIARYVLLLAKGFAELKQQGRLKFEPIFLIEAGQPKSGLFFDFRTVEVKARFLSIRELIEIPRVLSALGPGLYHSTSFSSLAYCPVPHMITVHDLNHLSFGTRLKRVYYRQFLKPFCKKAKRILTISEFSKEEIIRWLKVPESRVWCIPNAIDLETPRSNDLRGQYSLGERPFFSAIYSDKSHKNLKTLISSYRAYRKKVGEEAAYNLALVGYGLAKGFPGLVRLPALDDRDLRALMAESEAFLFPSIYEGLGLPPIEAVSSGANVLLSDIPPHRESFTGFEQAVTFVSARSEKDWVLALANVHGKKRNADEIARFQATLSERFSAVRMAEAHQSHYLNTAV